jgi:hypothetical protein
MTIDNLVEVSVSVPFFCGILYVTRSDLNRSYSGIVILVHY